MMHGFTLKNPHPDHVPKIIRTDVGTDPSGTHIYETALACSCGYSPGRVSDLAPAQGGKTAAGYVYRRHLDQELACSS